MIEKYNFIIKITSQTTIQNVYETLKILVLTDL